MGVLPLLESPVELAGLLPRRPKPWPEPAKGFGGVAKFENAAREEVRVRGICVLASGVGDGCGERFIADFSIGVERDVAGDDAADATLRDSGLSTRVTSRGGGKS